MRAGWITATLLCFLIYVTEARCDSSRTTDSDLKSYQSVSEIPTTVARPLRCRPRDGDGCMTRVRLKQNVTLWGLKLKAKTIAADWEENRTGILAEDTLFRGIWLKGTTRIWFYGDWGGTLQKDQMIGDVPCRANREVTIHRDGTLGECTLAASYEVNGMTLEAGTSIGFNAASAALSFIILGAPQQIEGRKYSKGTLLAFDERGELTSVEHEVEIEDE